AAATGTRINPPRRVRAAAFHATRINESPATGRPLHAAQRPRSPARPAPVSDAPRKAYKRAGSGTATGFGPRPPPPPFASPAAPPFRCSAVDPSETVMSPSFQNAAGNTPPWLLVNLISEQKPWAW